MVYQRDCTTKKTSNDTHLRKDATGRDHIEVSPSDGLAFIYRREIEEINAKLATMRDDMTSQTLRKIRDEYRANRKELPPRFQKKRDERAAEFRELRKKKHASSLKVQKIDAKANADISPMIESAYTKSGVEMPDADRKALSEYKKAREAKGLPKIMPTAAIKSNIRLTKQPRVREHHSATKTHSARANGGTSSGGGDSGSSDDGDGDSSDDLGDPPRPGARARIVHPYLITPTKKEKTKCHNRRPFRCWRMSRNTYGTQGRRTA